jgi:hypothetical protein
MSNEYVGCLLSTLDDFANRAWDFLFFPPQSERLCQIYIFGHISTNTRPPGIARALFQQCLENLHLASPQLPSPATNISLPSSQRSHFTSTTPQPTPTISSINAFNPPHKTLSIRQNGTTEAANLALLQLNSAKEPVKTAEP